MFSLWMFCCFVPIDEQEQLKLDHRMIDISTRELSDISVLNIVTHSLHVGIRYYSLVMHNPVNVLWMNFIFTVILTIVITKCTVDANKGKRRACKVFAGIDEPLYRQYDSNISYFTDMIQTHFEAVNEIYNKKVFTDDLSDIHFKLSRIQVMFGSCASFKYENCTENRSKYLEIFDQYDFSEFCLAYMFTYL